MIIGYARCSTIAQHEERQIQMLEEFGVEKLYCDKSTGRNADRPDFQKMMKFIREGDTVVVESISRLSRSVRDLLATVDTFTQMGVEFISLKENIDTTTPQGRFILTIFGACAELDLETKRQNQMEGIAIAKAQGKYLGRKPIEINEKKFRKVCARWRAGEITATAARKELGLAPNTFYRRVKEYGV